ncbi:hypothetical protein DSO57_1007605 [Entomophthora muscae]|uniref:Uncharacterized protein n=1 Tax=Entomophthora muscae TaxID=34485 RepID=A0ACC2RYP3_9FUNG|nr:hypothetical protein DSO57_1007605 [Entomophthora muscae]
MKAFPLSVQLPLLPVNLRSHLSSPTPLSLLLWFSAYWPFPSQTCSLRLLPPGTQYRNLLVAYKLLLTYSHKFSAGRLDVCNLDVLGITFVWQLCLCFGFKSPVALALLP